jgi:hypothetical protein
MCAMPHDVVSLSKFTNGVEASLHQRLICGDVEADQLVDDVLHMRRRVVKLCTLKTNCPVVHIPNQLSAAA